MQNLAGDKDCDVQIERELVRSGIEVVRGEKTRSEVPYSITGRLGNFEFARAWYYWMVRGNVPLSAAMELYADPVGVRDVRVAGMSGNDHPKNWARKVDGKLFVQSYHIDTEVGLRLFADTLKRHGLV